MSCIYLMLKFRTQINKKTTNTHIVQPATKAEIVSEFHRSMLIVQRNRSLTRSITTVKLVHKSNEETHTETKILYIQNICAAINAISRTMNQANGMQAKP